MEGFDITTAAIATPAVPESFDHINLNQVDDSRAKIPQNVYTLEVNKLELVYKPIKNPSSEYFGKDVPVVKGSFTIVDDDKFSGRKLWEDFYIVYPFAQKNLKKIMAATGIVQADGETVTDWSGQFATLNPAARFQVQVTLGPDKRDPEGEEVNKINFFTAKPC